jgi:D-3-phosphoglycerate dehydrogenase
MTTVFVSHPSNRFDMYFGERANQALREVAEVRLNPHPRELTTAELIDAARGCDAFIAYRQTPAPEALFSGLPTLAVFLRCAMDIRTVDVEAASAHGVLVTRASAGFNTAVAEWVIGAMIDLGRGITRHAETFHRRQTPQPFMGRELRGSTLGIVGLGGIGRTLCQLALPFGMQVLVTSPGTIDMAVVGQVGQVGRVRQVLLPELLAQSDFVVCLAPANAETAQMFNAQAFAAMQRGAFFINAARGELIDDNALLVALASGHLGGAALDVGMAPDQMPSSALAEHPAVIATPHIGGLTQPATEHQALETVAQLSSLLKGKLPPGAVNPQHAARLARWGINA